MHIVNEQEIKPHRVRYYPELKQKMAEVLCVYREVKLIKETAAAAPLGPGRCGAIANSVGRRASH